MTSDVNKIENKIKDLNEIRAIYHRDLEEFERQYNEKEISTKQFEKHKIDYDKKREKIRKEIHILEEKLEQLKKNS
jgi:chromosome segregation ATPase